MRNKNHSLRSFVKRVVVCTSLVFSLFYSLVAAQAQTPEDPPPIVLSKYLHVYVTVIDPNIVEDVFGKRISDRFVAIQVTISNKNANYQFLIHDVSLDLKNVFGAKVGRYLDNEALNRCETCTKNCMVRGKPGNQENPKDEAARFDKCKAGCGSVCRSAKVRFELSSLELSLIRGVAEKGQAQDKRNKLLRYLEGAGTIAAGFIGFGGIGPKYSDFMALYNGPGLNAYRHIYPDFTTNQMNRLSDSAYKSNTLVPKQHARVLVAFVPQSIFLSVEQQKKFRKDPTSLYPDYNKDVPETDYTVDFRRTVAIVDGNFVTEIDNLPPLVTGIRIDPAQALGFLKPQPEVRGYILGQFLEGSQIDLVNPPEGMEISLDKAATPEEGKIFFIITSTQPVPNTTPLNIRVFNKTSAQTVSEQVSYVTPAPTLRRPDPALEGTAGGSDIDIELTGTNFLLDVTTLVIDKPIASGVKISSKVEKTDDGRLVLKATLGMAESKVGDFKLRAMNGSTPSNVIDFTVTPKPTP